MSSVEPPAASRPATASSPAAAAAASSTPFGEKLQGRLLKGSFDKACALTCRFLCQSPPHPPNPPHPLPFSLLFHGKTTSDFLTHKRDRKEFLQQISPFFIAKCIATATVSLPQRNRNLFPERIAAYSLTA